MLNEIACLHIYSVLNGVFYYGTREDVVFLINGIPVLVIECKNARKDEAIALGVDQIRRYHHETPELFVSQQLFTATDAIGFSYGVSWNTVRRNIFNWKWDRHSCLSLPEKDRQECLSHLGNLELKVKTFCAIPQVLAFLKDYIVFAEKDEVSAYLLCVEWRFEWRFYPTPHSDDTSFYEAWNEDPEEVDVAAVLDAWRRQNVPTT